MEDVSDFQDSSLGVVSIGTSRVAGKVLCRCTPRGSVIVYNVEGKGDQNGGDGYHDSDDGQGTDVYEVKWSSIVWNKHTRKLVNQSHGFFMKLQQLGGAKVVESSDLGMGVAKGMEPASVVKYSQCYRSALKECVMGLKSELKNDDFSSEEEYLLLKDQIELYSMLETAWHLCEILFIETLPLGCLIQQLLEWVRWHGNETDDTYHNIMESTEPSNEPDYWRVIYSLTLQGRSEEVKEMLQHLPDCQRNHEVYESISELLRKMPMVRSVVGKTRTELRGSWYDWKRECKRRRDRGDYRIDHKLHILCGLLCGDEKSFKDPEVISSCKCWYEMMVGRLLYCSPLIINTDYDLCLTAETCLREYVNVEKMREFDRILLTALQNNVIDVIKISSSTLSNWWFVAHLSNILHHRGVLMSHHLEYGNTLTEFVLVEYASSLYNHPSLWQIAIDYLSHCPTQGRYLMMLLIERVPLDYDYKALKVLSVCDQYGLKDQAQSVSRVMARKAYTRGQLGNALTWSIRSKDSAFAAFIAEKYFDNYELHGKFQDLAMLDDLGDAMLLSKRLTFLGKYREIQVKYNRGDFVGAGKLLVDLLESGTVPKKYWITLLTDAIPLLELDDQLIFNSNHTYSLMRSLLLAENYFKEPSNVITDTKESSHFDINKEKIALLQLSLVRNLQRALLQQQ